MIQSSLPVPPISGLTKKRLYSEIGGERSHNSYVTKKNPIIWDLKMGGSQRCSCIGGGGCNSLRTEIGHPVGHFQILLDLMSAYYVSCYMN